MSVATYLESIAPLIYHLCSLQRTLDLSLRWSTTCVHCNKACILRSPGLVQQLRPLQLTNHGSITPLVHHLCPLHRTLDPSLRWSTTCVRCNVTRIHRSADPPLVSVQLTLDPLLRWSTTCVHCNKAWILRSPGLVHQSCPLQLTLDPSLHWSTTCVRCIVPWIHHSAAPPFVSVATYLGSIAPLIHHLCRFNVPWVHRSAGPPLVSVDHILVSVSN